mgnify:CR=1 FL=1
MAEVKDLENVEQEATAPAMEETAADRAAPAETRVNLKARWQAIPPVHTGTAAGDRRGGAAESAGRQEQR